MKKMIALLLAVLAVFSGPVLAHGHHRDREERYVLEEAARRNMKLITESEAQDIARRQAGVTEARFLEVELEDEGHKGNFRPVYKVEFVSGSEKYEAEIDAVNGRVLEFEIDD